MSPVRLIDPHLFEFRGTRPCMASDAADSLSRLIPDYETQASPIVASDGPTVVLV
jgi:hypothetical protein